MKIVLTSILLTTSIAAQAAINTIDGPIVNPANGHSYYVLSPGNWTDLEAYSETLGGHLVTINDAAENDWVLNTVVTDPDMNPAIGLYYSTDEGTWLWISGEPVTYLNWAPGEPNDVTSEDYYSNMQPHYWDPPGSWNNLPNSDVINGIAEVVPEPSTLGILAACGAGLAWKRSRRAGQ